MRPIVCPPKPGEFYTKVLILEEKHLAQACRRGNGRQCTKGRVSDLGDRQKDSMRSFTSR